MIHITDKSSCCGCTACENICPHQAITMKPDVMGFLYPEVKLNLCTDCGLCEKVCSFNEHYSKDKNLTTPYAYAVRHKKMEEIETSRSGATFIALSDWILDKGGVVYGAGYTNHFRVVHKRATTPEERNEFKGSKYVQSDLNTTFKQIDQDLKDEGTVLFSGTPCQTAGLRSFLKLKRRDCSNLYLCDIVCHGVPSPFIWKDYIEYLERKEEEKITSVDFRNKKIFGWASHKESFQFNYSYIKTYPYSFYKNIIFRHSCCVCHFANTQRSSDITLADFWGWEKAVDPNFNIDNKGVSLVLINTQKGVEYFEKIKKDVYHIGVDLKNCLQPNLRHPSIPHPKRDKFENDYAKHGFMYVMKKYGDMGWRHKIRKIARKIKSLIKK